MPRRPSHSIRQAPSSASCRQQYISTAKGKLHDLGLSQADRETFLSDFVERSTKSRPILPRPVQYNTRSVDSNRPNVSQSMYSELITSLTADVATARSETKRERVLRKFQTSRREKQMQILTDKIDPNMDMSRTETRVQSFKAALSEIDEERLGDLEQSIDEVTLSGSPAGTSTSVSRLTSAAGSPIQQQVSFPMIKIFA